MPYFYIITHKNSNKHYAGVRYAKGCDPKELLTEDGYNTSSNLVNAIIKESGLDSFYINRIRTFNTIEDAIHYEHKFLQKVDAKNNANFLNASNNSPDFYLRPDELRKIMLQRYGVDNCSKLEHIKNQKKETCLINHGGTTTLSTPKLRKKYESTVLRKYGVKNPAQADIVKEKMKKTNIERYGAECTLSSPKVREKAVNTSLKKYGVKNPAQADIVKEKTKKTNLERYGAEYGLATEEVKAKSRMTCMAKYGVDCYAKTPEARKHLSESRKGVGNPEFKGYYITPFGKFASKREIFEAEPLIRRNVAEWCFEPTTIVTRLKYLRSVYLKAKYPNPEDAIGKTFMELGFGFEPKI